MLIKIVKALFKALFKVLFVFILIVGGLLGWRVWQGYQTLQQTIYIDEPMLFTVKQGDRLKKICDAFYDLDLISDPQALYIYGRYHQIGRDIKAGEFELEGEYSPITLLETLTTNKVKEYQITFSEGLSFEDMLARLASESKLQVALTGDLQAKQAQLMQSLNAGDQNPEGLFFPSTYRFAAETKDIDIMQRAYRKMVAVLEKEWSERAADLPYNNAYEALIMASIVEKETGAAAERPQIAGVFVRRLKKKMRLQTDPTVIYGMGDDYQGNIKRAHLKDKDNIYNTYVIKGLPPTPIAMPGREAIHAALHPADGDALFFVAKGDGTHQFSATLEQHNAAVRKYQLKRRKSYRSTR